MRLFKKLFLLLIFVFLAACSSVKNNASTNVERTDFWSWNINAYFNNKNIGKVFIYSSKDNGSSESNIYIQEIKQGLKSYYVGKISGNDGYEIALLPGEYVIRAVTKKSIFLDESDRVISLIVSGGENYFAKVNRRDIEVSNSVPVAVDFKEKGSIYSERSFKARMRAIILITNLSQPKDMFQKVNVVISSGSNEPKFFLNGNQIPHQSKINSTTYQFVLKFEPGDNELVAKVNGFDGDEVSKSYNHYIKTQKDILAEKAMELEYERKRNEAEKIKKALFEKEAIAKKVELEKEATAKKLEEERIARVGDDSPDDLSCKKYGLKPQTSGYSECRMRLDLSRKEGERVQAEGERARASALKSRDDARKAELEKRYEEIQRQNAIIANRESKCAFVKSQEYLRPALGGFFESMNRANSAYDNCMAGVPQINTSCSKDGFGNINCSSR